MVYGLRAQSPKYDWDQGSEERARGSEECNEKNVTKADPALVPCARTPCPYQHRCNQPGYPAAHSGEDHTKLTRHREDRPKSSSSYSNSSRGHS